VEHLLAVETNNDGDVVTVHANVLGLPALVRAFQRLLDRAERGEPEHDHLMTENWGGATFLRSRRRPTVSPRTPGT